MRPESRWPRAAVVNMIDMRVLKPTPDFATYTLAKMGLWALTRMAAQALAPHVRVNGIGPGPTMQGARQRPRAFRRPARGDAAGPGDRTRGDLPSPCASSCRPTG
ncbi:MAG: hypothetical protein KatS3mg118_3570 [Paracoccaceae bacterium]|nr:MAG: hypothetical protein KatS3mg118_3570 [Paracoccaceae bacterium]